MSCCKSTILSAFENPSIARKMALVLDPFIKLRRDLFILKRKFMVDYESNNPSLRGLEISRKTRMGFTPCRKSFKNRIYKKSKESLFI